MNAGIYALDSMDIVYENPGDLKPMLDFYTRILGLPFHIPYTEGQEWFAVDAGNIQIFVVPRWDRSTAPVPRETYNYQIGFGVPDLDAAIAELDGKVTWTAEIGRWNHVNNTYYRFRRFADPIGTRIFVMECRHAKSPLGVAGSDYRNPAVNFREGGAPIPSPGGGGGGGGARSPG